jgi:lysylphosphatidylglycerol synthetase-like protein (DUF2156 family)
MPALSASASTRPANLVIGELFPNGQEFVLALILFMTARGILLRRRIAYYLVVTMASLSMLDALAAEQYGRMLLLVFAIVAFYRYRSEFTAIPYSSRLRTAVKTGAITYGLAFVYGIVVMIVDRHHLTPTPGAGDVGRQLIMGLTGSGAGPLHFDNQVDQWFDASLGLLGGLGLLAMLITALTPAPPPPPATALERSEAARLVDDDGSDTLAPFIMRSDKSYVFSPDRRAVIGYRVMFGIAVAGGDPVGDPDSYPDAVAEFAALAARSGWRVAVLGARGDLLGLWHKYGLRSIGYGDEVLLDPADFSLSGRHMRNVRQAVARTRNSGVTSEVLLEGDLNDGERARLRVLAAEAVGGEEEERGFSMNLDGLLTGQYDDTIIVVARDADGAPIGFQRYLSSAGGRRLSLDAMRRAKDSPNGLNERLIIDLMDYAKSRGAAEVSLNFAAFRELLDAGDDRRPVEQVGYRLIHLLDPLIAVESLYLFDRKFRPRYVPRSVVIPSWTSILPVASALLMLEFGHWGTTTAEPAERLQPVGAPEPVRD